MIFVLAMTAAAAAPEPGSIGGLIVAVLISSGFSSIIVGLLTLRPKRRKIDADATNEEATAASTLSGAALKMVQDADARAQRAEAAADKARAETRRAKLHADELERKWRRSEAERAEERIELCERVDELEAEVSKLLRREADLEDAMRSKGVEPPPHRRGYDQRTQPSDDPE